MAEQYTPNTEEIAAAWMHWRHAGETEEERAEGLARWLAAHDAQVLREAAARVRREAEKDELDMHDLRDVWQLPQLSRVMLNGFARARERLDREADRIAGGTSA